MNAETRKKIERQIAALRKQMELDSSDLEFELHLHMVRDLEHLLKRRP